MYSQTPKISSYIMTIKFMETTSNTSSLAKCLIDSPDEKNELDTWLVKMPAILLQNINENSMSDIHVIFQYCILIISYLNSII